MNVLDWIFIFSILIFSVRGICRGLINEVFGIGSFFCSLFFAFGFYPALALKFENSMNAILAKIVAFFAIFVASFLIIKIIQMLLKTLFSGPILNSLDKTLGLLLGILEGVAFVFLILFVMILANGILDSSKLRGESVISNLIYGIAA